MLIAFASNRVEIDVTGKPAQIQSCVPASRAPQTALG
jgi:hypothetical protein